jgi:hypothetical protein
MVLDSKITRLKHHFGISKPEDWQQVEPIWILSQDGIGPATLETIRIYLAARDLALKNDQTPEFWRKNISAVKIGQTMGLEEIEPDCDRGALSPFSVVIDTAEQEPFTFCGLKTDATGGSRPLIVPTDRRELGRHPHSLGDYSLDTGIGRCHVERKSMDDAHGTILGFADGRRERFEQELANLAGIEAGLVVVECSFAELVNRAPCWGKRTAAQNAKALHRSVLAFQQDYRVAWAFCDSRRMAEVHTYRWLERWHRKQFEARKAVEKRYMKAVKAGGKA